MYKNKSNRTKINKDKSRRSFWNSKEVSTSVEKEVRLVKQDESRL